MIPVEQQIMALFDERGDRVQAGDCMRASMASLFELPLEEVPHFVAYEDWWGRWMNWLHDRGLMIGPAFYSVEEEDPAKLNGWPGDLYWLATVKSPRGKARCNGCDGAGELVGEKHGESLMSMVGPCGPCAGTGLVPSLHSVVMFGREIAWDPHPQREMGHLGFVGGYVFRVIDPARMTVSPRAERGNS